MKLKRVFLLLSLVALSAACSKKNSSSLPPKNVVGYWLGFYGGSNAYPMLTYNFLFRADGTVRVYENSDTSGQGVEGTYQVLNTTVTTTYSFGSGDQYSTTATLNDQYTFMNGYWGPTGTTIDGSSGGDFYLVRQLQ